MVSSTSLNVVEKSIVPPGKYTVVGIDIDTTGRRLIDEIVQLAAFTPNERFQQYIMPYMNLNPAARQRHQVRVISIGFYRMLKSMQTYKIIKSKSEIAAVKDFLDWLEQIKAKDANSQGIILVYHEERKFIPYMILESLKKYNLLDRFANTVKSFANGLILAKSTVNENMQQLSLRKLSRALSNQAAAAAAATSQTLPNGVGGSGGCNEVTSTSMTTTISSGNTAKIIHNGDAGDVNGGGGGGSSAPITQQPSQSHQISGGDSKSSSTGQTMSEREREYFDGNASVRARLAYEVALQLSNRDYKDPINSLAAYEKMLHAILKYAQPIECDLKELETQNQNLERQNSFRPIFLNYFKTTLYHRVRAVKFRIILAEQGYDLQTLNAIWTEKQKAGIAEVLQVIEELKPEDKTELTDLFDSYFDPNKTTIKPIVKNNNRRRNRRGLRSNRNDGNVNSRTNNIERGAGGDKQQQVPSAASGNGVQLPDSTTNDNNQGGCGANNNNNNNSVTGGGGGGGGNMNGQSHKSVQSSGSNNGGKPPRNRRNQRSRNNSVKNQSSAVNLQVSAASAAVAPVAMPMVATN